MDAKQTPLIDLLDAIPPDARLVIEHDQFSASFHPVGRMCHEAAAELRRLHALNAELVEALRKAVKLNSFREFNDHIPAMKAALAKVGDSK